MIHRESNTGNFGSWLLAAPIFLLPFLFGGNRPWLWSVIAGIFFIGFTVFLWTDHTVEDFPALPNHKTFAAWLLPMLLLIYPLLQLLPLPPAWLSVLSPHRAAWLVEAWQQPLFEHAPSFTIAYVAPATLYAAFWCFFLVLFAFLFRRVTRDDKGLNRFLAALFVVALVESGYGLLQVLIPSLGVLWDHETGKAYAGFARGTFINKNHYACFLGMVLPLLLAYVMSLNVRSGSESGYIEIQRSRKERQKQIFMGLLCALILLSLVFSSSRGGIISALIGLTVFITFGGLTQKKRFLFFLAGCWVIVFSYGAIIGFNGVVDRFEKISDDAPGRFKIWQDTWHMIQDHPLTGVGLGNNPLVYSVYQSHLPDNIVSLHTHNDYLELAAELGLPVAVGMILLVWGYWLRTAWRLKIRKRGDGEERGARSGEQAAKAGMREDDEKRRLLRVGALAGTSVFLCHSWVEFNWQIPANQLYFVALLVLMGTEASRESRVERQRRSTAIR